MAGVRRTFTDRTIDTHRYIGTRGSRNCQGSSKYQCRRTHVTTHGLQEKDYRQKESVTRDSITDCHNIAVA